MKTTIETRARDIPDSLLERYAFVTPCQEDNSRNIEIDFHPEEKDSNYLNRAYSFTSYEDSIYPYLAIATQLGDDTAYYVQGIFRYFNIRYLDKKYLKTSFIKYHQNSNVYQSLIKATLDNLKYVSEGKLKEVRRRP